MNYNIIIVIIILLLILSGLVFIFKYRNESFKIVSRNNFLTDYCIYRRANNKELLCNSIAGLEERPQDSISNPKQFHYF